MHLPGVGDGAGSPEIAFLPLIAGRSGSQRRLTSSFRLVRPARKLLTLSWTASLVPKHRFPVVSSLVQPQMASSALKSGL